MTNGRSRVRDHLSADDARRIALAGQGFADARPAGRVDVRHLRRAIERMGLLQLDSVNVLCHSHYLPVFARIGAYPRQLLDRMAWGNGRHELFEYWGHQASLLPTQSYPLLRWRMEAAQRWVWKGWSSARVPGQPPADWAKTWDSAIHAPWAIIAGMTRLTHERPNFVDEVLALVADRGPVAARDANPDGQLRRVDDAGTGRMWNWQDAKIALEWLFCMGKVAVATRRNFERVYDLAERVLPADVLSAATPPTEDAQRDLVRIAARAYGIATDKQLCNYFLLPTRQPVAELVETGELTPVRVDGVRQQTYLWTAGRTPRRVEARALLSPFDPLIRDRDRTQSLFDFSYRISIYTPAAQRTHGYYVLPFLLGDRIVARVDLKADRAQSTLVVPTVNIEGDISKTTVAAELADELRQMADWLELEHIRVGGDGDLAAALSRSVDGRK